MPDYDVREYIPGRLVPQTDQATRLALIAMDAAVSDSALELAAMPDVSFFSVVRQKLKWSGSNV